MLISPYASYLVASGLRMSGICAILINGVILSSYGTPNTTRVTQKISKMVYEILAYSSETLVFLFLGIGLMVFKKPFQTLGWGTLFTTLINLNVARFLNIFICTLIVNRFRTAQTKFNIKTQFVMWFSGLRGAMAYAIAL
jgi:sodium/hydrogen exchanger 8